MSFHDDDSAERTFKSDEHLPVKTFVDTFNSALYLSTPIPVKLKKLYPDVLDDQGKVIETVIVPEYANVWASGADAFSRETKVLAPGERHLFKFGFAVQLPPGWEMQCRAKSGRALKEGLTMANGIGTIDTDYRGEMGAIVINLSDKAVIVEKGTKLAQLVIAPIFQARFEVVEELEATERGEGGFGSTGLQSKS